MFHLLKLNVDTIQFKGLASPRRRENYSCTNAGFSQNLRYENYLAVYFLRSYCLPCMPMD